MRTASCDRNSATTSTCEGSPISTSGAAGRHHVLALLRHAQHAARHGRARSRRCRLPCDRPAARRCVRAPVRRRPHRARPAPHRRRAWLAPRRRRTPASAAARLRVRSCSRCARARSVSAARSCAAAASTAARAARSRARIEEARGGLRHAGDDGASRHRIAGLHFDAQHPAGHRRGDHVHVMHAGAALVDQLDAHVAAVDWSRNPPRSARGSRPQRGARQRPAMAIPQIQRTRRRALGMSVVGHQSLDFSTPTRSSRSTPRRTSSVATMHGRRHEQGRLAHRRRHW